MLEDSSIEKLIVLIDDLDRCLPDVAINTLEAVRLFMFTEKTAFVIAADESMIRYAVKKHFPDAIDENKFNTGDAFANRYLEKSKEVFEVLRKYSDIIEKVSIDESYLDLTGKNMDEKAILNLKQDVLKNTGLKVSVGLSYNKFLAKLASDWNKPDGVKIIKKEDIPRILLPLDISKIHGIGKKSEEKLKNIGIYTVKDMYELSEDFLVELFGKMGEELYQRIRGVDNRKVKVHRQRKSLGTENTFKDTNDIEVLKGYLKKFSKEVSDDLIKKEIAGFTLTLKMKSKDFITITRSRTYDTSIYRKEDIYKNIIELFDEYYDNKKLRLIGLTVSNLVDLNTYQLSFF